VSFRFNLLNLKKYLIFHFYLDFLTGGQAMVNAILFTLYYISANPEVQEKVYEETLAFGDIVSFDDITKAHYTRAAIQECYRVRE
jgi:cytochrome P450